MAVFLEDQPVLGMFFFLYSHAYSEHSADVSDSSCSSQTSLVKAEATGRCWQPLSAMSRWTTLPKAGRLPLNAVHSPKKACGESAILPGQDILLKLPVVSMDSIFKGSGP